MHRKLVRDMVKEYGVNYSTIWHIIAQYYLFGRVQGRKFKSKGSKASEGHHTIGALHLDKSEQLQQISGVQKSYHYIKEEFSGIRIYPRGEDIWRRKNANDETSTIS